MQSISPQSRPSCHLQSLLRFCCDVYVLVMLYQLRHPLAKYYINIQYNTIHSNALQLNGLLNLKCHWSTALQIILAISNLMQYCKPIVCSITIPPMVEVVGSSLPTSTHTLILMSGCRGWGWGASYKTGLVLSPIGAECQCFPYWHTWHNTKKLYFSVEGKVSVQ